MTRAKRNKRRIPILARQGFHGGAADEVKTWGYLTISWVVSNGKSIYTNG